MTPHAFKSQSAYGSLGEGAVSEADCDGGEAA